MTASRAPPKRSRTNSGMVYPSGINERILRAKGMTTITASPFGTVNQKRPDSP